MEGKGDKEWATKYLLDPLTALEPSQEIGPGTHYSSTVGPRTQAADSVSSRSQYRNATGSSVQEPNRTSAKQSRSPSQYHSSAEEQFPIVDERSSTDGSRRTSQASTQIPTSTGGHGRQSSISSHGGDGAIGGALDMVRKDTLRAQRSPHIRKGAIPGPDKIDTLGTVGFGPYHHEGPYDATLMSRNKRAYSSPVKATEHTNRKALQATPLEQIHDSLQKHRPLDGVASIPPGAPDPSGRRYEYEEGPNMMIADGGNYKRWADLKYHPDDVKGKAEPSYTIEKSLKEHKNQRRRRSDDQAMELSSHGQGLRRHSRPRPRSSDSNAPHVEQQSYGDWERGLRRQGGAEHGSLRNRFGSLRM